MLVSTAAFLPVQGPVGRLYQGVAGPLHAAVTAMLGPVAGGFNWVGHALRFERERVDHGDDVSALHERIDELQNENIRLRGEVRSLRRQNRILQRLPRESGGERLTPRVAPVEGITKGAGTWSLQIKLGRRHGVRAGQPVISGASVVGRISRVNRLNAVVERIDSPGSLIDAVLTGPAVGGDEPSARRRLSAVIQLEAKGPMRFESLPPHDVGAKVGDVVHLWDQDWPRYARGQIIGRVVKVEDEPEDPLRKRIVVEAAVTYPSLKQVIVLMVDRLDEAGSN